jgi:outer membrane receptor for monomeric catechols
MVMSPRTVNKTKKSAGIVTEFQEGKRALSSAGIRKNAQTSHRAAEADLDRLKRTLASAHGMHPGLELMREKLSRAVCAVRIQHENRLAVASSMADVDVVLDMSEFVRRQVLPQAPPSGLSQSESLALLLVR